MGLSLCGQEALSHGLCTRKHALRSNGRNICVHHRGQNERFRRISLIQRPQATSEANTSTVQQLGVQLPQQHAEAAPHAASEQGGFDWSRQWYGVAVADQLDPTRPNKATLLGQDLAVWRDPEGVWRAFEDRCPHRLAPLTEGRIEEADGLLSCSYHGWRFDGSGKVQQIPQADDPAAHSTAIHASRACVASFPTTVRENMLWVWGESGPEAFIHSAAQTPAVTTELEALPAGTPVFHIGQPYTRDLFYDFGTLVENFLDPAHVAFAHHGVIGNRYKETAGLCHITQSEDESVPNGGFNFDATLAQTGPKATNTIVQFQPPGRIRYFTPKDDGTGAFSVMNLHCVPTGPNRSRVTYSLFTTVDNKFVRLGSKTPAWKDHFQRHLVLDGDHALLHIQEQTVSREALQPGGSWRKSYWMPTESDRVVTAWRQWLDANGGPSWAPGTPTPPAGQVLPKSVLLDRYEQHTKNCPHCLKALRIFKALRATAAAVSIVSALAALAVVAPQVASVDAVQLQLPAILLGAFAVAAAGWRKLSTEVENFYWVNYDHQANH